jgi:predicted Zn finger-like uncharacterized protein
MNVTCPNCASVYRVDPAKVPEAGVRARCAVCSAVFEVRREVTGSQPVIQESPRPEPALSEPIRPPSVAEPPKPAGPQPEAPKAEIQKPAEPPRAEPVRREPPPPISPAQPPPRPVPASPMAPPSRPAAAPRPAAPGAMPTPTAPPAAAPARPAAPVASGTGSAAAKTSSAPAAAGSPATAQPKPVPGPRPANPFLSQDPSLKARRLARALISDMVVYHPAKRQDGLRDGNLKEIFEEEIKKSWEEYAEQVGKDVAESTPYFREALNEILAGGRQIF